MEEPPGFDKTTAICVAIMLLVASLPEYLREPIVYVLSMGGIALFVTHFRGEK